MGKWIARIEWRTVDEYDDAALDLVMEHLDGHDAALSVEPTARPEYVPGWDGPPCDPCDAVNPARWRTYAATVTIEANTLRQAIAAGLELVEGSTGEKATGVEVLDAATFDHRVTQPSIPELVGYAEIADMLGVSRQRASQLADRDDFPIAVVETKAGPLRIRSQVEGWITTWERKNGRPKKVAEAAT